MQVQLRNVATLDAITTTQIKRDFSNGNSEDLYMDFSPRFSTRMVNRLISGFAGNYSFYAETKMLPWSQGSLKMHDSVSTYLQD